jgi:hypothetical protein
MSQTYFGASRVEGKHEEQKSHSWVRAALLRAAVTFTGVRRTSVSGRELSELASDDLISRALSESGAPLIELMVLVARSRSRRLRHIKWIEYTEKYKSYDHHRDHGSFLKGVRPKGRKGHDVLIRASILPDHLA